MDIANLINEEQFYVGIPTQIDNICKVYPVTLREIAQVGVKNFYSYLNLFTLEKEDIDEFLRQQGVEEDITPFQFTLINASSDEQYLQNLQEAFKFFLHEDKITVLADNEAIVLGELTENRLLMEVTIFADKVCVDEEMVRLRTHFGAFEEILCSGEPVGRKLDFLMQEMNRETNTIGSKCSNSSIAHVVVDIKCELEKIREQIQNIE